MVVKLKERFENIPEGSRIKISPKNKKNSNFYSGMWCSMYGSYNVSVPKKLCEIVDEEEEKRKHDEIVSKVVERMNKDNPKWQAEQKVIKLAKELGVEIQILD